MDNAANAVAKLFAKGPAILDDDQSKVESKVEKTSKKSSTSSSAPDCADDDVNKIVDVDVNADVDTEVDTEVAPTIEHTHVKKEHELREQEVIEKEKHQDHYHTTIQPLKESEVMPEKHDYIQEEKHREINRDDGAARAKAAADATGFENTVDEQQQEVKVQEAAQVEEHVHHHLHETIVPVVEKEVVDKSVTHKRVDIHEKIQEPSEYHGVTTSSVIDRDEFEKRLAAANK